MRLRGWSVDGTDLVLGGSLLVCFALAFFVPAVAAEITTDPLGNLLFTLLLFLIDAGVGISLIIEILIRRRTYRG